MKRLALRVVALKLTAGVGLAAAALLGTQIAPRAPSVDPAAPEARASTLVETLVFLREGHGAHDWLLPDKNGDRK